MAVVALDVIQDLSQVARTSRPVFKSSSEPAFTRSTTMVIQIVFHFVSQNRFVLPVLSRGGDSLEFRLN